MSDNPANITLKLALDQAALNQSAAGVDKFQKELNDLRSSLNDAGQSGDKAASNIGEAMSGVSSDAADATKQVQELNTALETTSRTANKLGKSGGLSGVNGLRRTGSALTQLGLGDIGQPVQKIGDLAQVMKELGVVSDGAKISVTATSIAIGGLEVATGPLLIVLGGVAVLLAGFAAAQAQYNEQLKQGQALLSAALGAQQEYYTDVSKLTTQAAKDRIDQLKTEQQTSKQIADENSAAIERQREGLRNSMNAAGAETTDVINATSDAGMRKNPAFTQLFDAMDKANESADKTGHSITRLQQGLDAGAFSTNDAAKAEKELQDIRDQNADKVVAQARQDAQLIASGSSKSVEAQLSDIKAAKDAITAIDFSKLSTGEADKLKQQWTDLDKEEKDLTANVLPLIKAREDEAQKIKDTTKALADQAKAGDDYEKAVTAENDARAKNAETIQRIEDDTNQQRADLEQSYADKRVDIARKAVETSQDELTKLQQKQDDLSTGLSRNLSADATAQQTKLLDIQINYQRQQVQDTQDHYQKLQDIQRNAQQSDQDALLNRNFRQLFENKQQTSNAIDAENQRYQQQEQQRVTALNQQENDEARAAAQQRQQRLIAYNQALADAQLAYQRQEQQDAISKQRQLQEAQIANTRAESALTTKENRTLAIQAQSYKAQLALLEQTELDKLQILKNAQAATQQVVGAGAAAHATGSSRQVMPFAAGGRISAFQTAFVNDPGSSGHEGFNGTPFPAGQGLFMPFKSGNINANMGNSTTHTTGPISIVIQEANNPRETEAAVSRALRKWVA